MTEDIDDFTVMADGDTHLIIRHDTCRERAVLGTGAVYPRAINRWITQHLCPQ